MKLGYLTAFSVDEARRARRLGFDCLEVHSGSWGTDHVYADAAGRQRVLDDLKRAREEHGITVSALAHYSGSMGFTGDELVASFRNAIDVAHACGAGVVTAIARRADATKSVADNIPAFRDVYSKVATLADGKGVRVAFENWPSFGGYPLQGRTLAFTPDAWEQMFDAVPGTALGLEFDPSHLYWQGIDHLAALRKFASRVYHVHAKDTEVFPDRRNAVGIYGDGWWTYRIPGLGEIDWPKFIAGLHNINYAGGVCIEHEDQRFDCDRREPGLEKYERGLRIGLATLRPLVG